MLFWVRGDNGDAVALTEEEVVALGYELHLAPPIAGFVYNEVAFSRLPLVEAPDIIEPGVLPERAKMVLYGGQKKRKSYLALDMAHHISEGKDWIGLKVNQARTLYLQAEVSHATLRSRIIYPRAGCFVGTIGSLKLDTSRGAELLCEVLEAVTPKVLILDPLYKFVRYGNMNDEEKIQVVLDFIDEWVIEKYGCACVIIHHKNRSGGLRGSGRLLEWPDTVIEMERLQMSSKHWLKFEATRNVEELEKIDLVFNSETNGFDVGELTLKEKVCRALDGGIAIGQLKELFPDAREKTLVEYGRRWQSG